MFPLVVVWILRGWLFCFGDEMNVTRSKYDEHKDVRGKAGWLSKGQGTYRRIDRVKDLLKKDKKNPFLLHELNVERKKYLLTKGQILAIAENAVLSVNKKRKKVTGSPLIGYRMRGCKFVKIKR